MILYQNVISYTFVFYTENLLLDIYSALFTNYDNRMERKKFKRSETPSPSPPPILDAPAPEPPAPKPLATKPLTFAYHAFGSQDFGHYWYMRWNEGKYSRKNGMLHERQFKIEPKNCPINWKVLRELKQNTLGIGLVREDSNPWTVRAKFHFRVENHEAECYFEDEVDKFFFPKKVYHHPPSIRPPYANPRLDWKESVNVLVEIHAEKCCLDDNMHAILPGFLLKGNLLEMWHDFNPLVNNSQFSDVTLRLEEESFSAHKCVLSARSPVLRGMIAKSKNNIVPITNMGRNILEKFLSFLYTGSLSDTKRSTAMSLMTAAYQYNVESLKKTCRFVLIPFIRNDTAFDILKLADTHGDHSLKDAAEEHIAKNYKVLATSSEWNELKETHLRLAVSISEKASRFANNEQVK